MNHHSPGLDPAMAHLHDDVAMKARIQRMLMRFTSSTETPIRGDLHFGSMLTTAEERRVIDPEFARYGLMDFEFGRYLAANFSAPGDHGAELTASHDRLPDVIEETFAAVVAEFVRLRPTERIGIPCPASSFEDQRQEADAASGDRLAEVWEDALTVCGIEMHRQILALDIDAAFQEIADTVIRAPLQTRCLLKGRDLIPGGPGIADPTALTHPARSYNRKDAI